MDNISHYDAQYWNFQKQIGEVGGVLNLFKFEDFIEPGFSVLDFGCGGGFLLGNIKAAIKMGIELSPYARGQAETSGLVVYPDFSKVESSTLDLVISNHALEHVLEPLSVLRQVLRVLKPGGRAVFVVPCEQIQEDHFFFNRNDVNQHLYTWCPMTLGNLFKVAGFTVESSDVFRHQWTPDYLSAYRTMPLEEYHRLCVEYAKKTGNVQVRTVGIKS